jgi:hypothetical protein
MEPAVRVTRPQPGIASTPSLASRSALARKSQLPLRKRSESASIPASGDEGLNPRSGVELVGSNSRPTSQPSNQSPPRAGNGNFPRRDRPAKAGSSPSRDTLRDAPEARKPRFPRAKCEITCEGPNPKTGWWCGQSGAPNRGVFGRIRTGIWAVLQALVREFPNGVNRESLPPEQGNWG